MGEVPLYVSRYVYFKLRVSLFYASWYADFMLNLAVSFLVILPVGLQAPVSHDRILELKAVPIGTVLNLRTTSSQKLEAVLRRARV